MSLRETVPDAGAGTVLAANPYGYYDASSREYVITRPDTPTPWMNYLGQGRYGGIISNTAGGFSFDGDPRDPQGESLPLQLHPARPARPLPLPAPKGHR